MLMQSYDDHEFGDDEELMDTSLQVKTEAKDGKKLPPIKKFKTIARGLCTQKRWTQDMQIKMANDRKAFQVSSQAGDGRVEILTFNAAGLCLVFLNIHLRVL